MRRPSSMRATAHNVLKYDLGIEWRYGQSTYRSGISAPIENLEFMLASQSWNENMSLQILNIHKNIYEMTINPMNE